MNTLRTVSQWMVVFAATLVFVSPVPAETQNRVVAIVNNEVITLYELNGKIRELTGFSPRELKERSEDMYIETRRKVLNDLIDQKIALEKIRELEITVSPEEVDQAIERVKADNQLDQEGLLAQLKERGTSYEAYRKSIKTELERMRLISYEVQSKIMLKEEDIEKYYKEHIDEFTSGGKIRLALIFLRQADPTDKEEVRNLYQRAQDIYKMIENGEDFGNLARKFSSGPGAKDGGDLGTFKLSELNPEMAEQIKGLSAGDVAKPIIRPEGIQIIKVVEKDAEGVKSLEQVRNAIQSILYREELERRYSAWISELRDKAYTKIIF
ncbi:MAG: SurA N-terminal domain-containing protein [Deltaproteobacteria bacterium]|nr:SurA N-terminal domain-containing protein [Deltaproteobacteria bacterium]